MTESHTLKQLRTLCYYHGYLNTIDGKGHQLMTTALTSVVTQEYIQQLHFYDTDCCISVQNKLG
jgi:hypothetical protein